MSFLLWFQVDFVAFLFESGSEETQVKWWLDWEVGRRCAALEGLQLLLLIASSNSDGITPHLEKIVRITSRFRASISKYVCVHRSSGLNLVSCS